MWNRFTPHVAIINSNHEILSGDVAVAMAMAMATPTARRHRGGRLARRARWTAANLKCRPAGAAPEGFVSEAAIEESYYSFSPRGSDRAFRCRYLESSVAEDDAPVAVMVHGFGASGAHFRKNMPALNAAGISCFAIDLLGYGYSEKPAPDKKRPNTVYSMERWGEQILDFVDNEIASSGTDASPERSENGKRKKVFLICNSIGGIAALQAAKVDALSGRRVIDGIVLMNVSLRMLHVKKQQPWQRPMVKALQTLLRETPVGEFFFRAVATEDGVRNVLREAYHDADAVDDTLVRNILSPGLEPGAVDVFLDFISYSGGPLPEELLAEVSCPVSILWGECDPWEPLSLAEEAFKDKFPSVVSFETIPKSGHCPMDESPALVNPKLIDFVRSYM